MTALTRYRAVLAYDGGAYHGFQRQAGETPTIQRAVEMAIFKVTKQQVNVVGAGRTDTGVHAIGQVIAFNVDWPHQPQALLRALNAALPPDIALQAIDVQPKFHPRYDAVSRVYQYTAIKADIPQPLLRNRAWQVWGALQPDLLHQTAAVLIGEHDFAAFGNPTTGDITIRRVMRSEWTIQHKPYGLRLRYTVEANAFLKHMVRRMVGLQVDVARGWRSLADFTRLLHQPEGAQTGTVAPPEGLVFLAACYPDDVHKEN